MSNIKLQVPWQLKSPSFLLEIVNAPLQALQWLNGEIDNKSAQSLTLSSLQSSKSLALAQAWISTPRLSHPYSMQAIAVIL
jgi:hypothetical protein